VRATILKSLETSHDFQRPFTVMQAPHLCREQARSDMQGCTVVHWRIQGGTVWGNFPPKRLWHPVKIAPLRYQCAPFLVLNEVKTELKIILNKQCFALC